MGKKKKVAAAAAPAAPRISARTKMVIEVDLGNGQTITAPPEKIYELWERLGDVLQDFGKTQQAAADAAVKPPQPPADPPAT